MNVFTPYYPNSSTTQIDPIKFKTQEGLFEHDYFQRWMNLMEFSRFTLKKNMIVAELTYGEWWAIGTVESTKGLNLTKWRSK